MYRWKMMRGVWKKCRRSWMWRKLLFTYVWSILLVNSIIMFLCLPCSVVPVYWVRTVTHHWPSHYNRSPGSPWLIHLPRILQQWEQLRLASHWSIWSPRQPVLLLPCLVSHTLYFAILRGTSHAAHNIYIHCIYIYLFLSFPITTLWNRLVFLLQRHLSIEIDNNNYLYTNASTSIYP